MQRRTVLAIGTSALASAACSLLVSTSGLSGAAAAGDGGSDGAGGDGSSAPTTGDGSSNLTDGGAGDAGTTFCAKLSRPPFFCADFDRSPDVAAGWDQLVRVNADGGLDSTQSSSPPNSFHVDHPTSRDGDVVYLEKTYPGTITSAADTELDILFDDQSFYAVSVGFVLSGGYTTRLSLIGELQEFTPTYVQTDFDAPDRPVSAWMHVTMSLHVPVGTAPGWIDVHLKDGLGDHFVVNHHTVTAANASGVPVLRVGVLSATGAWSGRIDNVTFDVK